MASHFRLYGRPLHVDEIEAAMTVTGELEGYTAGEAYESRLSINNSVGRCTVEVLQSTLPPGAFVRVDNITKEVVVKWAAYTEVTEEISLVPNGDFEDGDDGTWFPGGGNNGEGWSIGTGEDYDTYSGVYSARFANVKTKGSDLLLPVVPAKVNDFIRLTGMVQQGASSAGNAGARVSLIYYDANGVDLQRNNGNLVTSGKDGNWKQSVAEGGAPAGTAGVRALLSAYRNKENRALWMDKIEWNHKYTLGQDDDSTYTLSIKVTDSLNRVAYWNGTVEEYGVFLTSGLYPFYVFESLQVSPAFVDWRNGMSPQETESVLLTPSFVSFTPRTVRIDYNAGFDSVRITPSFTEFDIRNVRKDTSSTESVQITPSFLSLLWKAHPRIDNARESIQITPSFVSWS